MNFMDFFDTKPRIIPIGGISKKGKGGKKPKQNMMGGFGDFMSDEVYDLGANYGDYIKSSGGLDYLNQGMQLGKMPRGGDIGISLGQFSDVGGDYMKYIHKYSGGKQRSGDDFFSYIEAGTPKAFTRYGKESKAEKSYHSVSPKDEVIYGFEALGFATDRAEKSIGTAAKVSGKRIKKLAKQEREKLERVKGYVGQKLKERRIKRGLRANLEETTSISSDSDSSYVADGEPRIMRRGTKILTKVGKNKFGKDIYKVSDDLEDLR